MKTKVFSKSEFIHTMQQRNINDATVDSFDEYFICIDSTGGPLSDAYFLQKHNNVIRLIFDDVGEDLTKWGEEVEHYVDAKAMTNYHATALVDFIKKIPKDATINICCIKGKSRSVAINSFIINDQQGNQHVLQLLKQAWIS